MSVVKETIILLAISARCEGALPLPYVTASERL